MEIVNKKAFYSFFLISIVVSIICLTSNHVVFAASNSINVAQDVTTTSNNYVNNISYALTVDDSKNLKDLNDNHPVNWIGRYNDGGLNLTYERAAVKFSLAGITGTITGATFKFYVVDIEGNPVVNLISTTDDSWNETAPNPIFPTYNPTDVVYNSDIGPAAPYANVSVDTPNAWKVFNVKDYIQTCVDAGKTDVVIVLTGKEGTGTDDFNFVSNQDSNTDLMSKLDLTYTPAPTPPSVTGAGLTNNTMPTWSWTAGGGGNGTFRYKLDNNDLTSGATTTTSFSYTPGSALSGGSHTLYVQESNGASPARWSNSGSCTIVVDTTPPAAPAVTGTTPTNSVTPTWTWSSGGGGDGNYRYKLDDSDLSSGTTATTSPSYTPVSALSEGAHTLYVQERDSVANWSSSGSFITNIDTVLPTLSISAPSQLLTGSGNITYTITYMGADNVTLANGDIILNKIGTANGTVTVSGTGTASRTVTISGITGDGTLGITVAAGTASDIAGNLAVSPGSGTVVNVDNTAPAAPSVPDMTASTDTGASDTDNITKNSTPVFTGSAEVGSTVTLSSSVSGIIGTATADAGGSWSITSVALSDGSHTITAVATDAAGNISSASGGLTVTIDTSTPSALSVAVFANPSAGGTVTGGASTYSEGASVTVTATPNSGYTFVNWTEGGSQVSTSAAYIFTLGTSDRTLTANFTATSGGSSSVTVASGGNGTATGGGTYNQGQSVTLGAVPAGGYNFDGWYTGETKVSSLPNYTFTVTGDITLTAKFVPMPKNDLEVATVGSGTVKLNDEATSLSSYYIAQQATGASIRLTATANSGNSFVYWQDSRSGSVISIDPVYEFVMGAGVSVKAVFNRIPDASTTEFMVIFKDKNGRILQSTNIAKGSSASSPPTPALVGYSFVGWDKTFNNVMSDMTINALYERLTTTYAVTVVNGTLSTGGTSGSFKYDMPVTVVADIAPTGQKFSHWTQDGVKISTSSTYSFFAPMRATTLEAVFVADGTVIVEVPFITLSGDVQVDTVARTMLFTANRTVPAGYTLVESGVLLLQSNTAPAGELTVDTANVIRGKIKDNSTDQFYIRKINITVGDTWYARAYLIYKDANGNIITVYSDTVNRTMN